MEKNDTLEIIVTGATSFIGIHLLSELVKMNNKIYAVIRPNSFNKNKLKKFPNIEIVEVDQENISELKQHINRCDICYHLAWNGTRALDRYDEILQKENFHCSVNTFKVVSELGCKIFLGAGSQAEYGNIEGIITEETKPNPNTAYGKYKLKTCETLAILAERYDIRLIWGRIFSIYGEDDFNGTLLMKAVEKMKVNETLDMTDGTQYWNYLYVGDLVKILVALVDKSEANGIFNLASNDTRMLKEYILDLKKALKSKSIINFGSIPHQKDRKVSIRPLINKLLETLPEKKYNFEKFKNVIVKY